MAAAPGRPETAQRCIKDMLEFARDRLDEAARQFETNPQLALHDIENALCVARIAKADMRGESHA